MAMQLVLYLQQILHFAETDLAHWKSRNMSSGVLLSDRTV
jgi:hypothetical protein